MIDTLSYGKHKIPAAYEPPSKGPTRYPSMQVYLSDDASNFPDRIFFQIPVDDQVRITLLDMLGNELLRLHDEFRPSGTHVIPLFRGSLPAGKYLLRLQTSDDACFRVMSFT